jgi:hypothetical protein
MLRSISFLLLCAVVVFAAVWKLAPGFLESALPYIVHSRPSQAGPPASLTEPEKKGDGKSLRAARLPQDAAPRSEENSLAASTVTEDGNDGNRDLDPSLRPPVFRISVEDTALYSANSPGGRVVRVLKKGEIVQPQFRFINPGPEWTYVSVADTRVSGFLRSSSLRDAADDTTP